jgi:hypothetical protein
VCRHENEATVIIRVSVFLSRCEVLALLLHLTPELQR